VWSLTFARTNKEMIPKLFAIHAPSELPSCHRAYPFGRYKHRT
jgi:hypothetical protein